MDLSGGCPFYSEESQRGFPPFLLGVIPTPITRCVQVLTKLEASKLNLGLMGWVKFLAAEKLPSGHLSDFDGLPSGKLT